MNKENHPLVNKKSLEGYLFITENTGEKGRNQGQIMFYIEQGAYLCDLFSWLDGHHTCSKVFYLHEMKQWEFFENLDQLNDRVDKLNIFKNTGAVQHD